MSPRTPPQRLPRLRYALRHPADVLDRSGVPLWLALTVATFVMAVAGCLVSIYITALS